MAAPFDGKALCASQSPNDDAKGFDLSFALKNDETDFRSLVDGIVVDQDKPVELPVIRYLGLDEVSGIQGFSDKFNSDGVFRNALRDAIRRDIFNSTPLYAGMSAKAAAMLLEPDSSLQGSWRTPDDTATDGRMVQSTAVLRDAFGQDAPTGDALMHSIGALCGPNPSTHWIDIVGVLNRTISHSWHQDTGLPSENKTVLWGFPAEDDYEGTGVYSHSVPLLQACFAPLDHPRGEPIVFAGEIPEEHIIRPGYVKGKEVLVFQDVDMIHSSPDVAYRTSVMRFM